METNKRKYLSDCKDVCPGLLSLSFSDIDGSLVLVSCTTISVYVNLSKNMLSGRAHQRSATPSERRSSLICGCKGTLFPGTGKTFRDFFQKKMHFHSVYIIYYIRARKKTLAEKSKGRRQRGMGRNEANEPNRADGANRLNGSNGKDGADGKNGKDGKDGKDGKNGKDAKNAKDGKDGKDGKNGKNGENAKNGNSLRESARHGAGTKYTFDFVEDCPTGKHK